MSLKKHLINLLNEGKMKSEMRKKVSGISDESIKSKTGKNWTEWTKILDDVEAFKLPHKQIAEYLHLNHGISTWWSQSITVEYEKIKGLRETNQKKDGYQISASKTLNHPLSVIFERWFDDEKRKQFLKEQIFFTTVNPDKSLRFNGIDKKSVVEVRFYSKGESKMRVVVDHNKIPNKIEAEKMRAYWKEVLGKLNS